MLNIEILHATVADKPVLNGVSLSRHAELVSASIPETSVPMTKWTLNQVQGDGLGAGA
jgi:hypothetical protein